MKSAPILVLAATLLLGATGCTESHAHDHAAEPPPASAYKAGHGVQLSPAAAEFAGLATGEFTGRLPAGALLRTVKGDFVYVANGPWLLRTPVTLAADGLTVSEGLYEGDVIAVQGVRALWLAELQAINGGVGCADGH
ncbi:hypothetical protein ESB00_04325 [Oleiharenicola lentus]|uniref:Uncharacterized protein n=1 Tax=Oleiharenicola lentus TaxID=2508720 RepID=A0A4Q1C8F0_9BACT|nr:hypothetical protein [Oleiharenicola lentus]RXK55130.1 hypothetical protein ESB00_04325 [Oleiharenicola lentus]